jgi:hypothetical protein
MSSTKMAPQDVAKLVASLNLTPAQRDYASKLKTVEAVIEYVNTLPGGMRQKQKGPRVWAKPMTAKR